MSTIVFQGRHANVGFLSSQMCMHVGRCLPGQAWNTGLSRQDHQMTFHDKTSFCSALHECVSMDQCTRQAKATSKRTHNSLAKQKWSEGVILTTNNILISWWQLPSTRNAVTLDLSTCVRCFRCVSRRSVSISAAVLLLALSVLVSVKSLPINCMTVSIHDVKVSWRLNVDQKICFLDI